MSVIVSRVKGYRQTNTVVLWAPDGATQNEKVSHTYDVMSLDITTLPTLR